MDDKEAPLIVGSAVCFRNAKALHSTDGPGPVSVPVEQQVGSELPFGVYRDHDVAVPRLRHLPTVHPVGWMNIGWGFALTLSALATYQTSGGQLNPAISLLMATLGNMPYSWVLPYSVAQLGGAFTGAALAYGVYYERSLRYLASLPSPGHLTACFTSWPSNASHTTAFIDQVAGTAVLAFFICACVDRRNKVSVFLQPLFFGFLLIMIGCALNLNVGYPINPARDLGPRIFAFLLFGMEVFSHSNYYFWIPVVAPFFGALIGGWLYQILIGVQIDKDPEEGYELKQAV
ncbi:unnamed protein product, partial [Mesorhabditis spiculigera]